MNANFWTLALGLIIPFTFIEPAKAGQTSADCAAKWARSESRGGTYGEAMQGIQMSAPECYCQADINKVKTMGSDFTASYLGQCKK